LPATARHARWFTSAAAVWRKKWRSHATLCHKSMQQNQNDSCGCQWLHNKQPSSGPSRRTFDVVSCGVQSNTPLSHRPR